MKSITMLLVFAASLRAAPIVSATAQTMQGQTTYQYRITADTTTSIFSFSIGVSESLVDVLSVSSPFGWFVTSSPGDITWASSDLLFDILPGQELAGFGFTSLASPGSVAYLLQLGDPDTGLQTGLSEGLTSGPASAGNPVPEPSTMLLVASVLGVAMLNGSIRRKAKGEVVNCDQGECLGSGHCHKNVLKG